MSLLLRGFTQSFIIFLLLPITAFSQVDDKVPPHYKEARREMDQMLEKIRVVVDRKVAEVKSKRDKIPANLPNSIFKHYRGQGGIALPTQQDIAASPIVSLVRQDEMQKAIETDVTTDYKKSQPGRAIIRECTAEDESTREHGGIKVESGKEDYKGNLVDTLYVMPEDLKGIDLDAKPFGEKTQVFELGDGSDAISLHLQNMGVACVPYRVRVSRASHHRDYGLNALRNFDKNPEGRGKMSDNVAEKFGEKKKKR